MDKVELIYTKFVSLIASSPVVQTLLPLTPSGEVCDVNGVCVVSGRAARVCGEKRQPSADHGCRCSPTGAGVQQWLPAV